MKFIKTQLFHYMMAQDVEFWERIKKILKKFPLTTECFINLRPPPKPRPLGHELGVMVLNFTVPLRFFKVRPSDL